MKTSSKSEGTFLDRSRIALNNSLTNEAIEQAMAKFGYNADKIAEGNTVYNNAYTAWETNKLESNDESAAGYAYRKAYSDFVELFKKHRDLSRIFFKKQPQALVALGITGAFPKRYTDFFSNTEAFYKAVKTNIELQPKLALLNLTPMVAEACLSKLADVIIKRNDYFRETGESEESTKTKDMAFIELKEWMEDFDIAAKVALYEKPQLLESLGIFVRS